MKINEIKRIKELAGLKEFDDTQGQYTTTTAPDNGEEPDKSYVVRLTGVPPGPKGAQLVWAALTSVLPNDFPIDGQGDPGFSGKAQKLVARLNQTGQPQVVKTGLSKIEAQTIAYDIANWPNSVKIPTDVVPE